ncbi:hypothetical protein BD309DRAFT_982934 [Dichomitus squalens]|uniref:BHLH domain-containing protein n=1 Tax=Dichomitus squalens TaxID=114155 RepID=A0A4Q9N5N1_9APHY|nr:hypothetical protein BD311DRAFT_26 [Dichomitus squalens]TBU39652.1 hypothetical protein BD309DRAFT_982934 [Dichomitus squalens]TBU53426.1 hypothetical protein BD310DRAFT_159681 [Dichomitus squalens]
MALPLTIPDSPSAGNSPSSTDGSNGPQTPVSPSNSVQTLALPPPAEGAAPAPTAPSNNPAQPKRKPSRRANTAERRATHNAVERARRETLNGRFLDLAALLPNLSQIRRPSKSSIVNSSIAHIHASRRHRLLAARELRLLKLESDALRRELNEWRDRSGLPRVDEPVRGEAFQMILSGEVEVLNAGPVEEEGADGDYGDNDYGDDDYPGPAQGGIHDDTMEDMRAPLVQHLPLAKASDVNPFAHNVPQRAGLQLQTILPRPAAHGPHTPMIVQSPSAVSFENPAMMYDSHPHAANQMHAQFPGQYIQQMNGHAQAVHDDKAAWGAAQMFGAQVPGGPALFTPPASSHGAGNVSPMNINAPTSQQAYLLNLQRQQLLQAQRLSEDGSPTSGPINVRRERSGSINSNGSGYASPASNGGSYEIPSVMNGAAVPRRMAGPGGAGWDDGMNMGMGGMNMGMMKSAPISVGGGGNAHGYAAMML